jgi:hypothetical protein
VKCKLDRSGDYNTGEYLCCYGNFHYLVEFDFLREKVLSIKIKGECNGLCEEGPEESAPRESARRLMEEAIADFIAESNRGGDCEGTN